VKGVDESENDLDFYFIQISLQVGPVLVSFSVETDFVKDLQVLSQAEGPICLHLKLFSPPALVFDFDQFFEELKFSSHLPSVDPSHIPAHFTRSFIHDLSYVESFFAAASLEIASFASHQDEKLLISVLQALERTGPEYSRSFDISLPFVDADMGWIQFEEILESLTCFNIQTLRIGSSRHFYITELPHDLVSESKSSFWLFGQMNSNCSFHGKLFLFKFIAPLAELILSSLESKLNDLCFRVNQLCLLRVLNVSKMCSVYLLPLDTEEDRAAEDHKSRAMPTSIKGEGMRFASGQFQCPLVTTFNFPLHERLSPAAAISRLQTSTLSPFVVLNRKNLFVYEEKNGSIVYLRFRELKQEMSSILVLDVYGTKEPGIDVTQQLVDLIDARLSSITLSIISAKLVRQNNMKLPKSDLDFIRPPNTSPAACFGLQIPHFIEDHYLLLLLLRHILSKFWNTLNLETEGKSGDSDELSFLVSDFSFVWKSEAKSGIVTASLYLADISQQTCVSMIPSSLVLLSEEEDLSFMHFDFSPEVLSGLTGLQIFDCPFFEIDLDQMIQVKAPEDLPPSRDSNPCLVIHLWSKGSTDSESALTNLQISLKACIYEYCFEVFLRHYRSHSQISSCFSIFHQALDRYCSFSSLIGHSQDVALPFSGDLSSGILTVLMEAILASNGRLSICRMQKRGDELVSCMNISTWLTDSLSEKLLLAGTFENLDPPGSWGTGSIPRQDSDDRKLKDSLASKYPLSKKLFYDHIMVSKKRMASIFRSCACSVSLRGKNLSIRLYNWHRSISGSILKRVSDNLIWQRYRLFVCQNLAWNRLGFLHTSFSRDVNDNDSKIGHENRKKSRDSAELGEVVVFRDDVIKLNPSAVSFLATHMLCPRLSLWTRSDLQRNSISLTELMKLSFSVSNMLPDVDLLTSLNGFDSCGSLLTKSIAEMSISMEVRFSQRRP
jgi:hypothetical protein